MAIKRKPLVDATREEIHEFVTSVLGAEDVRANASIEALKQKMIDLGHDKDFILIAEKADDSMFSRAPAKPEPTGWWRITIAKSDGPLGTDDVRPEINGYRIVIKRGHEVVIHDNYLTHLQSLMRDEAITDDLGRIIGYSKVPRFPISVHGPAPVPEQWKHGMFPWRPREKAA